MESPSTTLDELEVDNNKKKWKRTRSPLKWAKRKYISKDYLVKWVKITRVFAKVIHPSKNIKNDLE